MNEGQTKDADHEGVSWPHALRVPGLDTASVVLQKYGQKGSRQFILSPDLPFIKERTWFQPRLLMGFWWESSQRKPVEKSSVSHQNSVEGLVLHHQRAEASHYSGVKGQVLPTGGAYTSQHRICGIPSIPPPPPQPGWWGTVFMAAYMTFTWSKPLNLSGPQCLHCKILSHISHIMILPGLVIRKPESTR